MIKDNNWGGARKGAGRPSGSTKSPEQKKTAPVTIHCTPAQKEQIKALAEGEGLSVTKYILQKLQLDI